MSRYAPDHEIRSILSFCHDQAYGGHFSEKWLPLKYFDVDFIIALCLKMPMNIVGDALDVSSEAVSLGGI